MHNNVELGQIVPNGTTVTFSFTDWPVDQFVRSFWGYSDYESSQTLANTTIVLGSYEDLVHSEVCLILVTGGGFAHGAFSVVMGYELSFSLPWINFQLGQC